MLPSSAGPQLVFPSERFITPVSIVMNISWPTTFVSVSAQTKAEFSKVGFTVNSLNPETSHSKGKDQLLPLFSGVPSSMPPTDCMNAHVLSVPRSAACAKIGNARTRMSAVRFMGYNAANHRRQKAARRRSGPFCRPSEFALLCFKMSHLPCTRFPPIHQHLFLLPLVLLPLLER